MSRANVEKLLTARTRPTTHAYLLLALYAGLRVSEIAALRGECFDLTAGIVIVKGKGGRVDTLPLHPKLVTLAIDDAAVGMVVPIIDTPRRTRRLPVSRRNIEGPDVAERGARDSPQPQTLLRDKPGRERRRRTDRPDLVAALIAAIERRFMC